MPALAALCSAESTVNSRRRVRARATLAKTEEFALTTAMARSTLALVTLPMLVHLASLTPLHRALADLATPEPVSTQPTIYPTTATARTRTPDTSAKLALPRPTATPTQLPESS